VNPRALTFADSIKLETAKARALFTTGGWNAIMRTAANRAGSAWAFKYLPLRWQNGYARSVLGYRGANRRSPKWVREQGAPLLFRSLCDAMFEGWDPWSSNPIPEAPFRRWLRSASIATGKFNTSNSGQWQTAKNEYRAWAKRLVETRLAGVSRAKFPFLDSGEWVERAATGTTVEARATKGNAKAVIRVPIGHPIGAKTSKQFRRIPERERAFIAEEFARSVRLLLSAHSPAQPTKKPLALKGLAASSRQGLSSRAAGAVRSALSGAGAGATRTPRTIAQGVAA
jgi:hypothetical protein